MAVHLVLRRPIAPPAAQLRIVWQGHREGDLAEARWSDSAGNHQWPGAAGVRWLQRDGLRQGEEWKVNLPGVPLNIDRIVLRTATTVGRTVGIAVLPLTGDPNDAALHPGAELIAGRPTELLELRRSGTGWSVTALNTSPEDVTEAAAAPLDPSQTRPAPIEWAASQQQTGYPPTTHPGPQYPGPESPETPATGAADHGPQVQIPARLESAADAARAGGKTRRRTVVVAVVDVSASMRPWIVSGNLADVLTAVQAVAGVSNRPSVATRFLPADQQVEVALSTEPADVLRSHLEHSGLRTGDRSALLAAFGSADRPGGLRVLITDDASTATEIGSSVVVLLGPDSGAPGEVAPPNLVTVPPGPVDVRKLARELAEATADS